MKTLILSFFVFCIPFLSNLIAQDVWFVDAGAGIVRADPFADTYSYVIFNGISFPDNIVVDKSKGVLYWTDWTKDKIRKAKLDGSKVEDVILGVENPEGMALDTLGQMLYWVEFVSGDVKKAKTDGSTESVLIAGLSLPKDIVVDVADGFVFVTTSQGIQRINTNGSNPTLILPGNGISGIDFNASTGQVYYGTSSNEIKRMNVNGGDVQSVITGAGSNIDGIFFDPIHEKIYWTDYTAKKLYRSNLDGSGRETLITSPDSGISDAYYDAAEDKLYWVEPSNSQLVKKSLATGVIDTILDGDRWGQISDISLSPLQQKIFFLDRDSKQIVSCDRSGNNTVVILDSLDGVVSLIFDPYGNDIYWSDRIDKIIYRSDASGHHITPLIHDVDVISMDIDFVTKTMYFIDLADKKIKYANLDVPVVQTITTPPLTEPEDLAVQMETRKLFWIDDAQEDIYSMDLTSHMHQLYINQATNMTYLDATESLSGLVFIDAGKIIFTDDVNPSADILYYPGQVFPEAVRVLENAFIFNLMPAYSLSEELRCDNDSVTVTIDPYGAIPPVTFTWSDGYVSTNAERMGVPEGNYTVTMKDVINRTAMLSIPLMSQFDAPTVDVEVEDAIPPGAGSAMATVTGGQPPYTVVWLGEGFESHSGLSVDPLYPGDYSLTVQDGNGCSTTVYFTVEIVNAITNATIEGLHVFPTVAKEVIHVFTEGATPGELTGYELFDLHARLIEKRALSGNATLDVNDLLPGLYSLKIYAGYKWTVVRFVKE